MIKSIKIIFFYCLVTLSIAGNAAKLKVFGAEFCSPYDAGSCINFEKVYDAKNLFWQYKYPKGRKVFDDCKARSSQTDGDLAFCAMLFHREEQTDSQRVAMCEISMIEKYLQTISGDYAMWLYLDVWKCRVR